MKRNPFQCSLFRVPHTNFLWLCGIVGLCGISATSPIGAQTTPGTIQRISVVRSGCEADCPTYTVHLDPDGTVTYDGQGFVKTFGQHRWRIPEIDAKRIFAAAASSDLMPPDQSKLVTGKGKCTAEDGQPSSPLVHVGLTVQDPSGAAHNSFPAATCYSENVAQLARMVDEATHSAVYATGHDPQIESEILAVLNAQVEAWNRGDLEGYMRGYWNSPNLTFFSGAHETSGWSQTLDRYRKAYKSSGKEMGSLTFSNPRVELFSTDSAFVRGEWALKMSDGKSPHGLFTLIFRKMPDGWRIIHDHTSAAD